MVKDFKKTQKSEPSFPMENEQRLKNGFRNDINDINSKKIKKPLKSDNFENLHIKKDNLHIKKDNNTKLTPMICDINDINDINDISINIKNITYHYPKLMVGKDPFEKILLALFPMENKTYQQICNDINQKKDYIIIVMNRNKNYFEEGEKKEGNKTFKLSRLGKEFVERKIETFEEKEKEGIKIDFEKKTIAKSKEDLVLECKEYMNLNKKEIGKAVREGDNVFYINFKDLSKHSPQLTEALLDEPEEIIELLEVALEETALMKNPLIRIKDFPDSYNIAIEGIRKEHLNKIISVDGRVTSTTTIRPQVVNAKFECPSCGTVISVLQIEKKFREPSRCSCGRKGHFKLLSKEMEDCARIVLEDLQEKTDNPYAQRLKTFIRRDLVNDKNIKKFMPGNEIRCIGILKEVPIILPNGSISTRFDYALEVISVEELQTEIKIEDFTKEEVRDIKELSNLIDENGLDEINSSFAPDIEGYNEIKNALIFQCCNKRNDKTQKVKIRNKTNILLISDPGMAKTVLGDFAISITPHSRKAIGGSSSAVGITASLKKEDDGYLVEPGAMVLAKELLLLDELNNLSDEDKPKLQQGMEQGEITINKANQHLTLKVTSGMLATANPEKGTFEFEKPVTSQFNIPKAILNRFDVIFAMKDKPKDEDDKLIARKIINREREKIESKYDIEFLTKFFAYIRNAPKPEIDNKMQDILEKVYVRLRKQQVNMLTINPRFLVSLNRLIKASAKLRLSEKVEEKDVDRALEILAASHFQTIQYKLFNFDEDKEDEEKELIWGSDEWNKKHKEKDNGK